MSEARRPAPAGPGRWGPLCRALRDRANARLDDGELTVEARDDAYLILALARMVEGHGVPAAFGAPGAWGYERPIGAALAAGHRDDGSG